MKNGEHVQQVFTDLDTSRFGRDQAETTVLLHQLRKKYGIDVVFAHMPQTGTYMDQAFEAIMSAFDYIHSQQSKAKPTSE